MTNAIREGARLGATLPEDSMTGWDGWAADVKDRVLELAGGDLDGSEVCVEMVEVGGSPSVIGSWPTSGCSLSMAAPSTPNTAETGECLVKVWAERTATLNAGFFSRDLGLTGKAVGLYERGNCPV